MVWELEVRVARLRQPPLQGDRSKPQHDWLHQLRGV